MSRLIIKQINLEVIEMYAKKNICYFQNKVGLYKNETLLRGHWRATFTTKSTKRGLWWMKATRYIVCSISLKLHHIVTLITFNQIISAELTECFTSVAYCTCLSTCDHTIIGSVKSGCSLPGKSQTFAFTQNQTIYPLSIIVIPVQTQLTFITPQSSSCGRAHHLFFFIAPGMHHRATWFSFCTIKQLS